MNDPANSSALPPASPRAAGTATKSTDRVRLFTPIDSAPPRSPKPLGRLTPAAPRGEDDDLDIEAAAPAPTGVLPSHPAGSDSGRPILLPNTAISFLQEVHARSNPELVDRRISTATRTLAVTALVAAVALVIGSSILFRAPSVTAASPAEPTAAARPLAAPVLTAAESAAAVSEALATLDTFLIAPTAALRRQAIGTDEPLPAILASDTHPAPFPHVVESRDAARLLHAGTVKVVLVPVTDGAGLPRTAAVVHRGDRWRVDWRSLITPETAAWSELVAGTPRGPSQFRVLLSRRPEGTWSLARPAAETQPLTATTAAGSRVAAELEAALAARNGQPLSVDLFLATNASRTLNIVGWTPDKWSL